VPNLKWKQTLISVNLLEKQKDKIVKRIVPFGSWIAFLFLW
jgi:hypothetical protein